MEKIYIFVALALVVGGVVGYGYNATNQTAVQTESTSEYTYGRGIGQGRGMGMMQDETNRYNRSNCLAEDCLLVDGLEYPAGELTQEAHDALVSAINDEYTAHATYEAVIEKFGLVRPFSMIIRSEEQHIAALKAIFDKYGVRIPEDNINAEVPGTLQEACQTGVDAEVANAALYREELLPVVKDYPDITAVFDNLMSASETKHLSAFEKCN